jgi:hypothetical protein
MLTCSAHWARPVVSTRVAVTFAGLSGLGAAYFAALGPIRDLTGNVFDFARGGSADHDGGTDHVGGALLTSGTFWAWTDLS